MAQTFWSDLWMLLNTDVGELGLVSTNTAEMAIYGTKSLIDLAGVVREHRDQLDPLPPILATAQPLLNALDTPMAKVVGATLPFGSIALGILKACHNCTQTEPTLGQCVALVGQAAYLESLQDIVRLLADSDLKQQVEQITLKVLIKAQNQTLSLEILTDKTAKEAVTCFHASVLAQAYTEALLEQIPESPAAKVLADRVARNTHRFVYVTVANAAETIKSLADLYRTGGEEIWERDRSIQIYLQGIAEATQEFVFGESFRFADIYIPLQAEQLDQNGRPLTENTVIDLETWAASTLQAPAKQDQVLFIQAGPGRGKSIFCRMFADWVRQHLYPAWIPILIRLRDVDLQRQFRDTLRQAVNADFAATDPGWLTDPNTRFLFLLDGFDELLLAQQEGQSLKWFLENVGRFQEDCARNPKEMGHRILVTGRPLALQGIEYALPTNLARVAIALMDEKLQDQWLQEKWQKQVDAQKTEAFRQFLRDQRCPQEVKELAGEPLLLYLLATLHREGALSQELFKGASGLGVKVKVYQTSIDWILNHLRPLGLTNRLTALTPTELRRILAEAALCVTQSGKEQVSVARLNQRLAQHPSTGKLLERAQAQIGIDVRANILVTFHLRLNRDDIGAIEFVHKSFREFLTAENLQRSLEYWTQRQANEYGDIDFKVPEDQLYPIIYNLLGHGALTPEIVQYLMALLDANPNLDWVSLFNRLHRFYLRWTQGSFINKIELSPVLQAALQLRNQGLGIGQRQIDIYTGLNILILLLEIHRYAQSQDHLEEMPDFCICGEEGTETFDSQKLLRIIGYSQCLDVAAFNKIVGGFLRGADLRGVDLRGVDLLHADLLCTDLSDAYLSGADFSYADLRGADLSQTYLSRVDLSSVDLHHADLRNADLGRANLRSANLRSADLRHAYLHRAYLHGADLRGADLRYADLRGVDLRSANLCDADLRHAFLSYAYLYGAKLRGTDLRNANLHSVNLGCADLRRANLRNANLHHADLDGVLWDLATQWSEVNGLNQAVNVPSELARFRAS